MFANMLDNTMREINESITGKLMCPDKQEKQAMLARKRIRTTTANIEKIDKKIQKLLDDFAAAEEKKGDVEYALTLVFYPVAKKKRR
jgi:transcription termination factor NusB